jgi:cellulose biosynthesis protein BcsQ
MVKVMGMLTLDTVPGLNRHSRNALVAAPSRIGLPVLCETLQLPTLPLPESTVQTITPLPVTCRERAS